MYSNPTLLILGAFSGLAGAILTQLITAFNGYFTDKRKQADEINNQYRAKMVEIGESYYYVTGEKMASIKKNIGYWKNWDKSRTDASLEFLYKETLRFNTYMEKLNADNWKFNLIGLYFEVSFTNEEITESNAKSQQLYLSYLDLAESIRKSGESDKEILYQRYALVLFDMCSNYEGIYSKLAQDMHIVKNTLLNGFAVKRTTFASLKHM